MKLIFMFRVVRDLVFKTLQIKSIKSLKKSKWKTTFRNGLETTVGLENTPFYAHGAKFKPP